jgi:excisionase family DNA binding protein
MNELLTVHQVAEIVNASPTSIRRWSRSGRFPPAVRLGENLIRWRLSDVQRWIEERGPLVDHDEVDAGVGVGSVRC